jgi:hypothetical protein
MKRECIMISSVSDDDHNNSDVVVGEDDKKQRSGGDKLVVAMLNGGSSVEVAYGEEEKRMAFWEFLSKRLYPALKERGILYWDAEEVSLRGTRFFYNHKGPDTVDMVGPETVVVGEGQQFAFNYENRLRVMIGATRHRMCCMGCGSLVDRLGCWLTGTGSMWGTWWSVTAGWSAACAWTFRSGSVGGMG